MVAYSQDKFNEMIYNPFGKHEMDIEDDLHIGILQNIFGPEVASSTAPEGPVKMICYILYLYDFKSPLRKSIPDIGKRKEEALSLAGIIEGDERIEELFMLKDPMVAELVYRFLKFQGSKEFMLLSSNEETFYQVNAELIKKPIDYKDEKQLVDIMEKKAKILQSAELILGNIHRIEDMIFKGDNAKEVIKKIASTRPEARAKRSRDTNS